MKQYVVRKPRPDALKVWNESLDKYEGKTISDNDLIPVIDEPEYYYIVTDDSLIGGTGGISWHPETIHISCLHEIKKTENICKCENLHLFRFGHSKTCPLKRKR